MLCFSCLIYTPVFSVCSDSIELKAAAEQGHLELCQVLISAGVDANDEGACRQRYLMFAPDTYTFCVPYIPFTSPLFAVASLH
jgi:hypothetical protein